jgi:hypothetical protein
MVIIWYDVLVEKKLLKVWLIPADLAEVDLATDSLKSSAVSQRDCSLQPVSGDS